jgi:hypothetical protein
MAAGLSARSARQAVTCIAGMIANGLAFILRLIWLAVAAKY